MVSSLAGNGGRFSPGSQAVHSPCELSQVAYDYLDSTRGRNAPRAYWHTQHNANLERRRWAGRTHRAFVGFLSRDHVAVPKIAVSGACGSATSRQPRDCILHLRRPVTGMDLHGLSDLVLAPQRFGSDTVTCCAMPAGSSSVRTPTIREWRWVPKEQRQTDERAEAFAVQKRHGRHRNGRPEKHDEAASAAKDSDGRSELI
jgi:hypothetical protein